MCLTWCHPPRDGTQEEEEEVCQERADNAFVLGLVLKVAARCLDRLKMSRRP